MIRPFKFVLALSFLSMAPVSGAIAQVSLGDRHPDSDQVPNSSSVKRNYPGGRDESDLTVQPQKRITKKETEGHADDIDEGDYDQGDTAAGFGE